MKGSCSQEPSPAAGLGGRVEPGEGNPREGGVSWSTEAEDRAQCRDGSIYLGFVRRTFHGA